jgi:very-short-patch-repair endonuclease
MHKRELEQNHNSLVFEVHNDMLFYYRRRRRYWQSDPAKFDKAYEMRHNPTRAEAAMWDILRGQIRRKFPNHIFRRQYVQYGYILDFYCPTLRLGIEVDGYVHDEQKRYDYGRDNNLARHGIQIFRFSNDDVLYNTHVVASELCQIVEEKNSHRGFIDAPVNGTTIGHTLQRKTNCFIATAAYGTPMAQEINTLRRFRDSKMEPTLIGRYFIALYYNTSPPFARVIARSKNIRAFVRMNLKLIIRFLEIRQRSLTARAFYPKPK